MKKNDKKENPSSLAVEISDLSFSYAEQIPVLKKVSLSVIKGERLGIIGPSGAGKSTLLLHLNGVLQGEGSININGMSLNEKTIPEIRRKVGLVFQNPDDQLFNPTVEEDVAFGPLNFGMSKNEVKKRVLEVLETMNLSGFEKKTSHHLSYGEKKRVALATVLSMRPEIVAFDEPFSNVDPQMVKKIMTIIGELKGTVIIVSQEVLPLIACCHRLAVMNEGNIMAVGNTKEIATNTKLLGSCEMDFSFYCDICKKLNHLDNKNLIC